MPVRVGERFAALECDFDDAVDRQQASWLSERLQRATRHILHDQIAALVVGDGVEYRGNVRVRELAGQRSLCQEQLIEALAVFLVAQRIGTHQLDGHLAVGERIVR